MTKEQALDAVEKAIDKAFERGKELSFNLKNKTMKNLKIYYWEKTGYHNGASFAIAESLQEAKELIIKEFKTN